jgi:hypothetical protein
MFCRKISRFVPVATSVRVVALVAGSSPGHMRHWAVLDSRLHFLKPPVQLSFSCLLAWKCFNEFDLLIFYRTCRQGRSKAFVWHRSCACAASQ